MFPNSPVFPPQASTLSHKVDALFFFMLGGAIFFSLLIVAVLVFFLVKYRRRHPDESGRVLTGHATLLEITWTGIPFVLLMVCFFWGAHVFFGASRPPADAAQYYVYGKQWMWKVEHPDGKREINAFHVPVGVPIKLTMTSEDVIHDFAVPAFRLKMDVLPGRYTTAWFKATAVGQYHIFCDQYCGVEHSKMVGTIYVMEPQDYRAWVAGQGAFGPAGGTVASGAELFVSKACTTCHRPDSSARAPILQGVFGSKVALLGGQTVTADENYIRESILNPQAKIVQGYQPIMPTFKDQLSEEEVIQLIKYIKDLKPEGAAAGSATAAPEAPAVPGSKS